MNKRERLEILGVMDDMARNIDEGAKRSVRPVYGASEKLTPYHIGSALLLDIGSRKVFLTAAHVVDHADVTTIYVGGAGSLIPLEGEFRGTPRGQSRRRDRYDFSFLLLSEDQVERIGDVPYLTLDDIVWENGTYQNDQVFTALGYPNSRNADIDNAVDKATSQLLSYSSLSVRPKDIVRALPNEAADHLFIRYRNSSRYGDDTPVRSIDATGTSGGALLDMGRLSDAVAGRRSRPRLAGLIIERVNGTLVATKLETIFPYLLVAMQEKFGGVDPKSKAIETNR